jgi:radical SAM protein with 4Fe4S-binding SPASM domain
MAVNHLGELYPCDYFSSFPEFKIGDIYNGFNETNIFFTKMKDWIDDLYTDCQNCFVCKDKDIRLCPQPMCLAENYVGTGNPLKPTKSHCWTTKITYEMYDYIAKKAIKTGVDKLYYERRKNRSND